MAHARYFADSVRDDYAAGQLDAQVRTPRSRPTFPTDLLLQLGRGRAARDARALHMRRELDSFKSDIVAIADITH
jgi:hypothetical protein